MGSRAALVVLASVLVAAGLAPGAQARLRVVDRDASYAEGPLWLGRSLFYVAYGGQTVKVWDGRRARVLWRRSGCGPSGLAQTARGTLLVTCYDEDRLVEIDLRGTTLATIRTADGPNDLVRDARGGVYFTTSGVFSADAPVRGEIHYLTPAGRVRRVARRIHYANGVTLSADGRHLFVAEALEDRVLRYAVRPDGTLRDRRIWLRTRRLAPYRNPTPLDGPDGLKTDAAGRLYVTQNGSGRVLVVSARRRLLRIVRVGTRNVTNVALGPTPGVLAVTAVVDPNNSPYPGRVYVGRP